MGNRTNTIYFKKSKIRSAGAELLLLPAPCHAPVIQIIPPSHVSDAPGIYVTAGASALRAGGNSVTAGAENYAPGVIYYRRHVSAGTPLRAGDSQNLRAGDRLFSSSA